MSVRTVLGLTTALVLAAAIPARADGPVPQALKSFKPYQVVEQIITQQRVLSLSEDQVIRLGDLSTAIRTEKHQWMHQGGKPHTSVHMPMIGRQQAYEQALAILTPEQRDRLAALYPEPAPATAPRTRPTFHGKP